jgi:hypothetical protein
MFPDRSGVIFLKNTEGVIELHRENLPGLMLAGLVEYVYEMRITFTCQNDALNEISDDDFLFLHLLLSVHPHMFS